MWWKEFVSDYLRFSRRDRIAVLALFCSVIIIFFIPHFLPQRAVVPLPENDSLLTPGLERIKIDQSPEAKVANNELPVRSTHSSSLFYFDPNSISLEDWEKLGLREKTIHTIMNYLSKGGKFRKADDLKKIYGLKTEEFNRISAFIRIATFTKAKMDSSARIDLTKDHVPLTSKTPRPKYTAIDINHSDTSAWIALPGIGSKLAARIVSFREKLGGFYEIGQVAETFGLPDSTFQKIKDLLIFTPLEIKKININTASPEELKKHPYIRWALASAIIAYRNEHGVYKKLEELKNIMAITEDIYRKISNYLTF